jgi:nucleotide-binding universal stress UspA family protein
MTDETRIARNPSNGQGALVVALDSSMAAAPVAKGASMVAKLLGAELRAVHVSEGGTGELAVRASKLAGIPLEQLAQGSGSIAEQLERSGVFQGAVLIAVGARSCPNGRYPVGHVAMELVGSCQRPVLVVPPEETSDHHESSKVLISLDGTEAGAKAIDKALDLLHGKPVELVALHVFAQDTLPRFWDQETHASVSWSNEFLSRQMRSMPVKLKLKTGSPAGRILEAAKEEGVSLIVMGVTPSGSHSSGMGDVIREVLSRTEVPVLLVPGQDSSEETSTRGR